jgi:hypothetical protein
MELNHQIRFCRPFPFRFGFRALCDVLTCLRKNLNDTPGKNDIFLRPIPAPGNHSQGTFGGCLTTLPGSTSSSPKPAMTTGQAQ